MSSGAKAEVKHAARKAESSRAFRVLARAGYAANGFVHVLIGVIVLVVAFGGDGETDQAGAFKAVAAAPAGFLALWILADRAPRARGCTTLLDGILASERRSRAQVGPSRRGVGPGARVHRARRDRGIRRPRRPTRRRRVRRGREPRASCRFPAVRSCSGLIGIGIGIGGIVVHRHGGPAQLREQDVAALRHALGAGVKALGVVGFIAKGVALIIVGDPAGRRRGQGRAGRRRRAGRRDRRAPRTRLRSAAGRRRRRRPHRLRRLLLLPRALRPL